MSKSCCSLLALAAAMFVLMSLAPSARAIYGPLAGGFGADIISVDNASDEQGNAPTTGADISADGRYVVFQTRATNFFEDDGGVVGSHGLEPDSEPPGTLREGGIFRYDRVTGAIQLVADGSEVHTEGPEKGKLVFQGAENPSVSSDGRYIVFSTAQQLVPQDHNENVDVYVRDMTVSLTAAREDSGAYTLVSAKSGGDEPAAYAPRESPLKGAEPGAETWPDNSISANGQFVVFRTTELESDLPDRPAVETPPEQLFVRDLQDKTTTLISRTFVGQEPAPGCGTGGTTAGNEPACGAIGPAVLSADGSTVAWTSEDAPEQTRFLPGEPENAKQPYYLWRRWQEAGAQTRRISGVADPEDPECHLGEGVTHDPLATGPCYGPLSQPESELASIALSAPALSADGYTVAFLAGAALRPNDTKSSGLDVFLTNMSQGMTRKAGTRELTLAVKSGNLGSVPSIESLALSSDGTTIAFTSSRDDFVLSEPQPIGAFRPFPNATDLYVIHLRDDTLERAVVGDEGGDPEGSISINPTLTDDGSTLAFASSASNLIFGDANQVSDAFTATLMAPAGTATPSSEVNSSKDGFSLSTTAVSELGLHVRRGKRGDLILLVETPGAGKLVAQIRGTILTKDGRKIKKRKVVLAHGSDTVREEGTATLVLPLSSRYAKDLKRMGKLAALVTVVFTPSTPGEALTAEVNTTLISVTRKKHKARRSNKLS